jgi:hypothetical protein
MRQELRESCDAAEPVKSRGRARTFQVAIALPVFAAAAAVKIRRVEKLSLRLADY